MDDEDRDGIEETILGHHLDLLTDEERRMLRVHQGRLLDEMNSWPVEDVAVVRELGLTDDPTSHGRVVAEFLAFRRTIVDRVLRDHAATLTFNRCPACRKIAVTPAARHCRWCRHDWH
jgi:hypothetical protein